LAVAQCPFERAHDVYGGRMVEPEVERLGEHVMKEKEAYLRVRFWEQ
jgi:hypothetical protein